MSDYGYFKSIIKIWNDKKHTPAICKDMREVLRQFDSYKNELDGNELEELTRDFRIIRQEVYK